MSLFVITKPNGLRIFKQAESIEAIEAWIADNGEAWKIQWPYSVAPIGGSRLDQIAVLMSELNPDAQGRWCESEYCYCLGAANCSGQLTGLGYTRAEWEQWKGGVSHDV